MKKRSKREKEEIESKKLTQTIFILGLMFLSVGLYRFFFTAPLLGINSKTHQPIMSNGSFFIFIGVLQLILGIYRKKKNI